MDSEKYSIVAKEGSGEFEVNGKNGVKLAIIYPEQRKYRIRFASAPGWAENGKLVEFGTFNTPEEALQALEQWDGRSDVEDQ